MAILLAAIAAGVGVLGVVYAALVPQMVPRRVRWQAFLSGPLRPLVVLILVATGALVLLTVPAAKPFAPGMRLGFGFLIGAVLGLWSLFEATGGHEGADWTTRVVAQLSLAALGPSAVLLIFRGDPPDALMGCALGAALVAASAASVLRPLFAVAGEEERPMLASTRGVEVYALATAAVAGAAWLAVHRFADITPVSTLRAYWAFPALLPAATVLALMILSGETKALSRRWAIFGAGAAGGLVITVIAAVLGARMLPKLTWEPCLYGAVAFGFILAVLTRTSEETGESESYRPVALAFGAVLLALAVVATAFRRMQGYGEALSLLAALPLVASTWLGRERTREPVAENLALGAFTVLLLLMLYRVYLERVGESQPLSFRLHYDYLAAALGLGGCFGLLAFVDRGMRCAREGGASRLLPRTIALGVVVAATPLLLIVVWGSSAGGAFLAGLVLAEVAWMLLAAWMTGPAREQLLAAAPHPFFLAAALVAAQLSRPLLAWEPSRAWKLAIVAVATAIAVVWVLADARRRSPSEGKGAEGDERAA